MLPFLCPTDHTVEFLERVLPRGRLRILEVGCGNGDVALRLGRIGHQVVGIDVSADAVHRARALGVDARLANLLTFTDEPFDVVLFTRSLHHVDGLSTALHRASAVLKPRGHLVAEEFDVDAMDRSTAVWFFDVEALLEAAGALRMDIEEARSSPSEALERWRTQHASEHRLHTGAVMLDALGRSFDVDRTERVAYLYRYLIDRLEANECGYAVAREVLQIEARRVEDGAITPIGLRVVAKRRV
jgi:ubiquinone/menaquinone biosynthesis C-methylase UbiE